MAIFRAPLQTQHVWCPTWYCSNFIAWAEEVVHVHGQTERPFNLVWSRLGQGVAWCGVLGCPYPYITVGSGSTLLLLESNRELCELARGEYRGFNPRWGAYLTDEYLNVWVLEQNSGEERVVGARRSNGHIP
jgi:hypothetical protein